MRSIRMLLFPIGILYGIITFIRNKMFDWGIFKEYKIPIKSISIGNLSVGGTGKTPHIAFLASLLSNNYKTTILSRGYGRNTKGYVQANFQSTASQIGDEPLFYFSRFSPQVSIVVCESRKVGVQKIIQDIQPDVILLDDAFQHRKVKTGFSILLMDYTKPFYSDFMLPSGDLREFSFGKKRAQRLIITKCPTELSPAQKKMIISRTGFSEEKVYFSRIIYGEVLNFDNQVVSVLKKVLLVTGIANPLPLFHHLQGSYDVEMLSFTDHHAFSVSDIQKIHTKFDVLKDSSAVILTTEKDFMRLKSILSEGELVKYPWCYLPIKVTLDRENEFEQEIKNYVDTI